MIANILAENSFLLRIFNKNIPWYFQVAYDWALSEKKNVSVP